MSTMLMALVWPLQMPPSIKAVAVSLADQANDEGSCWPAKDTLARRTCLSVATVGRAIGWMVEHGLLKVDVRFRNDGSLTSNLYTLVPEAFKALEPAVNGGAAGCQSGKTTGEIGRFGDEKAAQETLQRCNNLHGDPSPHGDTSPHGEGGSPHHDTLIFNEPIPKRNTNTPPTPSKGAKTGDQVLIGQPGHENPGSAKSREGGEGGAPGRSMLVGLKGMLEQCQAAGVKPIPADDPIMAYCDTVGLGRDVLALHWWVFKRKRLDAGKRQRGIEGWRKAFRNSVKDNWYRLWFLKPGQVAQLSTTGLQALAEMQAERNGEAVHG